jgi:hypothetical protein
LPERQRSLRAVFEYSWALLSEQDRHLFAQCSAFRGGFTREAAQQITGTTLRALTGMINKSLLRRDNITGRYEIHELLRQYAEEKLSASQDPTSIYDLHSQYYLGLLPQLAPKLKGGSQLEALTLIETDFENIRCAWTWAVKRKTPEHVERAVEGLYLFLTFRNRFMDGEQLFGMSRQAWPAVDHDAPLIAGQALVRYPPNPPLPAFERGLAIAEAHHDAFEIAFCRRLIGHHRSHNEFNQEVGVPMLETSLQEFEALGEMYYVALTLDDLGWSYNLMMRQDKQKEVVNRSLELRRGLGDKIGMANSLRNLGGSVGGFFDGTGRSKRYWEEAKAITYEMHDRLGVAWNASLVGANLLFLGQFAEAEVSLDEAYPHAVEMNHAVVKGFILISRSILASLRDEAYDQAQKLFDEGLPPGTPPDFRLLSASFAISVIACGRGYFDTFWEYYRLFKNVPFGQRTFIVPVFMPVYLKALIAEKRFERAAELMNAYLNHTAAYTGQAFPSEWFRLWPFSKRLQATLKDMLSEKDFEAAWQRGAMIQPDEMSDELIQFLETNSTVS